MIKIKRIFSFVSALVLTFSALAVWAPGKALAATRTWDGGGSDNLWSTAANWSANTAPVNGDVVVFDVSILESDETLENDLPGLTLAGISRTGVSSGNGGYQYTVEGNPIVVMGSITGSIEPGTLILDIKIILGADLNISNMSSIYFGVQGGLDLAEYDLTVSSQSNQVAINNIEGSGDITVNDGALSIGGDGGGYTGTVRVSEGTLSVDGPASIGADASLVVSGESSVGFSFSGDFLPSFTIGGAGIHGNNMRVETYMGSGTLSLKGGLTLTSNITVALNEIGLKIEEPYTPNGHTISLSNDSSALITYPGGETTEVEAKTVSIAASDKQPNKDETVGAKQIYIIDGERRGVTVAKGGTLKGVGTVNYVSVRTEGVLAPGHSPGKLTILSNLSMDGNSIYEAELKSSQEYDRLEVGEDFVYADGAVRLGIDDSSRPILKGIISDGFKINATDTFTIIDNKHTSAVVGTFKDLPEGATFKISDGVFRISYVGGDGNDVVLSVVTIPRTPSSGFGMLFSNIYVILAATLAVAGAAFYLSRRFVAARNR